MIGGHWQALAPSLKDALAAGIRNAVLDGRIRPADQLPAERRLAEQLGVSRGTVVAALARLRADGWVATRHGSGSTVRIPPSLRLRYAPLSVDHQGALLDLRRAVPAAPHDAFTDAAARALARSQGLLLEGGEPGPGLPELREEIAARFTSGGLPTRPQQVLVTAGAKAAMNLLVAHFRPRAAVIESPTFYGIPAIIRQSVHRVTPVTVTPQGWHVRQFASAFAGCRGGIAVLVPDFHNPTGALMDGETRTGIAALARGAGVTVVANEIMRDLDLRDRPPPVPRIPGAIIVGSMSKTVWGGLRVGWIRGPVSLIRSLLLHPLCAVSVPPPMEQPIARELFPQLDPLIRQRVSELRHQRDFLAAELQDDDGWTFAVPQGGLWLWLRLHKTSGDELAARAAATGLALLPGARFSLDGTFVNWLRFPYTAPVPTLGTAVALLRKAYAGLQ